MNDSPLGLIRPYSMKINEILTILARADFQHDFNFKDKKKLNELFTKLENTENINNTGKKSNSWITEMRTKNINVFDYFYKSDVLLPYEYNYIIPDPEILALNLIIGIDTFSRIQETLRTNEGAYGLLEETPKSLDPPKNVPLAININGEIKRNYTYSAYPVKVRGEYYNLPYVFTQLSSTSKREFALLIDSSFFSFSTLRKQSIIRKLIGNITDDDKRQNYTFYIIKNNENIADSAYKLDSFLKERENIKIKILRDKKENKSVYPHFRNTEENQNVNLFSRAQIITEKKDVLTIKETKINVDGNVTFYTGDSKTKTKQYTDLHDIGSIPRASFLALQKSNELNKSTYNDEALIHLLFKRSGDWCQALSLLDRTRMYEIYDYDELHKKDKIAVPEGEINLYQLKEKGVDIGLVTHDRILLAYSLLLGLNVFFSTKLNSTGQSINGNDEDHKSIIWNIYFKNTSDVGKIDTSLYNEIKEDNTKYFEKLDIYVRKANTICEDTIQELKSLSLKHIPEGYIYNTILPLNQVMKNASGKVLVNLHLEKDTIVNFLQNFIIQIRYYLRILANLTPSEFLENEIQKLKDKYNEIIVTAGGVRTQKPKTKKTILGTKSNKKSLKIKTLKPMIKKENLFDEFLKYDKKKKSIFIEKNADKILNLNDLVNKINTLHSLNLKLSYIYTDENKEEDKKIIKEYFLTNNEEWKELFEKISDDYNIAKDFLKDDDEDIFYDQIIPYMTELIYNGYTLPDNNKMWPNICFLLLQLRDVLVRDDLQLTKDTKTSKLKICDLIDNRSKRAGVGEGDIFRRRLIEGGHNENNINMDNISVIQTSTIKNIYEKILELNREPRRLTKYVNDDYGNFYSVINNIYITNNDIKIIINGIYKIHYSKIKAKNNLQQEILHYIYVRFLIYYLDEIYTRLFSLSGDNETYDEDLYYQYLRIKAELHNINYYTYENGIKNYHGIFTLVKIYEKDRYKWTATYLEEFMPELRTDKKGLIHVYELLLNDHNKLHENFERSIILFAKKLIKLTRKRTKQAKPIHKHRHTHKTHKRKRFR